MIDNRCVVCGDPISSSRVVCDKKLCRVKAVTVTTWGQSDRRKSRISTMELFLMEVTGYSIDAW